MRIAQVVYWMRGASEVKMPATSPGTSIIPSQNRVVYPKQRVNWKRNASFTRA